MTNLLRACAMWCLVTIAPAHADIQGDLLDFWNRSGGGANVTRPMAFQGQLRRQKHNDLDQSYSRSHILGI